MNKSEDRLFAGVYPTGIVYADRTVDEDGDYKRLAFLEFATLELTYRGPCPRELKSRIDADVESIRALKGQHFSISTSGQSVVLGRSCATENASCGAGVSPCMAIAQ
ncbi:hypothetical protein [Thioalkalivibrio thiocyanodenitrificans]|uniref:hypothetical protein n=1 Tax=Thioalkalivibrio thiocyanodenitrificans TaxID=243063 RepID=UPI00037C98B2|nr:hypothetical protein [Thioalkalivibrio thiocyanodenitrificans]